MFSLELSSLVQRLFHTTTRFTSPVPEWTLMERRTFLAILGTGVAPSAGCTTPGNGSSDADPTTSPSEHSGSSSAGTTVREQFDEGPSRDECDRESERIEVDVGDETREFETASTIRYPAPPSATTDRAIVDYVTAFEEAYMSHRVLCNRRGSDRILNVGFNVERIDTFDNQDGITTVFLLRAAGATSGVSSDGAMWQADLGYEGIVYAVDETGAARVTFDDVHRYAPSEREANAPDPLNAGTLVATFDDSE